MNWIRKRESRQALDEKAQTEPVAAMHDEGGCRSFAAAGHFQERLRERRPVTKESWGSAEVLRAEYGWLQDSRGCVVTPWGWVTPAGEFVVLNPETARQGRALARGMIRPTGDAPAVHLYAVLAMVAVLVASGVVWDMVDGPGMAWVVIISAAFAVGFGTTRWLDGRIDRREVTNSVHGQVLRDIVDLLHNRDGADDHLVHRALWDASESLDAARQVRPGASRLGEELDRKAALEGEGTWLAAHADDVTDENRLRRQVLDELNQRDELG